MSKILLRTIHEVRAEQLEKEPAFRAYWQRTALPRAVALAVIGYRAEHKLTQTKLAQLLGIRQPRVARLELGEHTPSLEMLQRLSQVLGLRFIVQVSPAREGDQVVPFELPSDVKVVEDLTSGGSRVLVAAG